MAVSFKVPASPKRSIFNIDNFLGVDLTNTGANIEEVRSPNAENMVRYVPGKVRKRTGYEKEILFGKDINVNYAIGTSAVDKNVVFTTENVDQWVKIYDLINTMGSKDDEAFDVYYEFDYLSTENFYINDDEIEVIASGEEWAHFSYTQSLTASDSITDISIKSLVEQSLYVRNFSVMYGKDSDYKWSPAPKFFVERESNDSVYGVHVGRRGAGALNRVVNVNRALGTATAITRTLNWGSKTKLYDLGEVIYPGRKVYIEFDYKAIPTQTPGSFEPYLEFYIGTEKFAELPITTPFVHYSGEYTVQDLNNKTFEVRAMRYDLDTTVKNLSVLYEMDVDSYTWSVAPEDNLEVFHIEDTYYTGYRNYSIIDTYAENVTSELSYGEYIAYASAEVQDFLRPQVHGMTHISFTLNTSGGYVTKVRVSVAGQKVEEAEHVQNKRYEFFACSSSTTDYIRFIDVGFVTNDSGIEFHAEFSGIEVNEVYPRTDYTQEDLWRIYHVGTDFYLRQGESNIFTRIYDRANAHLSKSWQFNERLFVLDGKDIYVYDVGGASVVPIGQEEGYIPTVTIAKEPAGGGKQYEPLNMLQPGFIELFRGDATSTVYHLSFNNLDNLTPIVWFLNGSVWEKQGTGNYTYSRLDGTVTFRIAPPRSPIEGEDNIKIQAYRTVPGYRERITKCTNGTLFGVGGAEDRLFLTGNPDHPNWDFYSERYDATYFPDTGYSALGSEQSAIVGYSIINNYLAAFKDGFDQSQTVFIREGDLTIDDDNVSQPAFKLINTLQGNGVVAPYAFSYLANEPVFLTKAGIYAITAQDITGEKYSQNRSFYLNGKLTSERNLADAVATTFNDLYVLAVDNQLYILDGLQATRTDRSEPYATRQYVGFHCTGIPAVCLWTDKDRLYFGTNDGRICSFHKDVESLDSYNDDGQPIYCCWETPDLDGKLFYKNKTFRYFAIRMMKALRTSVKLWSEKLGGWNFIKEDSSSGVVFDFENIDFENFSFSTDTSEKVVHTKVRVKKVDKARFRVENGKLNEPFGLFDLALEYVESGNYKG